GRSGYRKFSTMIRSFTDESTREKKNRTAVARRARRRREPLLTGRYQRCSHPRVHSGAAVLTVVAALLVSNCGSVTPAQPTTFPSPSPTPSLIGMWQGSTQGEVVRAATGTQVGFNLNCSQRWEFTSQT